MTRRRRWILVPLAALGAGLIVFVVLFGWNWLKGPIEGLASAALERRFEVGDLDVDLSTAPVVTLDRVRIANADWGSRPDMLSVAQVRFAIELSPLLRGDIRLPFLRVQEPDLLLETNREGLANWKFGEQDRPEAPPAIPIIRDLEITGAVVRYRAPDRADDVVAALGTVEGALGEGRPGVQLSARGNLERRPLALALTAAPLAQLEAGGERYPFRLDGRLGATHLRITGSAERPLQAAGLGVEVVLESREPELLLALAGIASREIPPLEFRGQLARDGSIWRLTAFDGRLGQSDIHGRVTAELDRPKPLITADLTSDQIRLEDLEALLPAAGAQAAAEPEAAIDAALADAGQMLEAPGSDERPGFVLDQDVLPGIDLELSYAVSILTGRGLALSDLYVSAHLEDGLPRLELVGGGRYRNAPVELDVRAGRPVGGAADARAYPIDALIKAADTVIQVEGEIGKPAAMDGLDLQVRVMSDDLNELLALADLSLPPIPPFLISGHVLQDGRVWRVADFYGQFSESELAGAIKVDLGDRRPFVTADLESSRLLVDDLMAAGDKAEAIEERIDEAPPDAEPEGDQAIISAAGIDFDALPEIDADVAFRGAYIDFAEFRFDQLGFDLKLREATAVLDASGEGQFRNGPLAFEAHAGTEDSLENPKARYPIDLRIDTKKTLVAVNGTSAEPGRTAGLQVDVALEGPNLDRLGEVLQLSLPATPPFSLRSGLTRDDDRWNLTGLAGDIGDSDIEGDATIVLGGERPILEAELSSKKLDFDDLGLVVGAPADDQETLSAEQRREAAMAAAEQGVLPDEPLDVPELRAMDARVRYRAERVQAPKLPLEGVVLDLTLEDGRLMLEPLRFDLAGGHLDSVVRLDGRGDVLAGELELGIRQVRFNRLLSGFDIEIQDIEMEREGVGTFGGRAELAVHGESIQDIAGSADGTVAIVMDGGLINALIVEAIGLDVGEAIALLLTGDEEAQSEMVPIQCFIGRFDVQDGVMQTEALVLETSDSTITGSGRIDLGEETVSLQFLAHPKDPSILTASTPVRIDGTFENPEIDLISEELEEKSLAALALGVVMPVIGAILPFFEEGETEDSNCARLIADARAAMPAGSASGESD
jgi:uncharacterized protein involved in outer membrane biogenesis